MPEACIELEMDEGALDAFVAYPDGPGRRPPILLLSTPEKAVRAVETWARRLSAHNYFVLAPDLSELSAEDRREAAWACLDHLADERRVDDSRVGVLGFGVGADLAIAVAASRAERVAAVAAYGVRGFGSRVSLEISQKINGLVRLGYAVSRAGPRRDTRGRAQPVGCPVRHGNLRERAAVVRSSGFLRPGPWRAVVRERRCNHRRTPRAQPLDD